MAPDREMSLDDADPRNALFRLQESLTTELEATHEALLEIRQLRADRSDDDEHDPEGAPLSGEWSRLDRSHRAAQQRLRDVQQALAGVDAGRYGICVGCGETIAPARLEVRPTADRCVRCAEKR